MYALAHCWPSSMQLTPLVLCASMLVAKRVGIWGYRRTGDVGKAEAELWVCRLLFQYMLSCVLNVPSTDGLSSDSTSVARHERDSMNGLSRQRGPDSLYVGK